LRDSRTVQNVVLPYFNTTVSDNILSGCESLSTLTATNEYAPKICASAFDGVDVKHVLLFTSQSGSYSYESAEGWKEFSHRYVTGQDLLKNTGDSITVNHMTIVSLGSDYQVAAKHIDTRGSETFEIPAEVMVNGYRYRIVELADSALCDSTIHHILISSTVAYIDSGAIRASNLNEIVIPSTISVAEPGAFRGCNNLKKVIINSSELVNSIKAREQSCRYIFGNQVTDYILNEHITEISAFLFYGCSQVDSFTFSHELTSIGDYAFAECKKLSSIVLPETLTQVGSYIFSGCTALVQIEAKSMQPAAASESSFRSLNTASVILFVPVTKRSAYAESTGWKDFVKIIESDFTTSVNSPLADENEIQSTRYYSPSGKQINTPQKGLNLMQMQYRDGNTKIVKIIVP
jgi:hypothetical protein